MARRRFRLALGGSALLIVASGIAAWSSRPGATEQQSVATAAATRPVPAIRRTLVLASVADLASALVANGFAPDDIAAIDAAVRPAVPAGGELRAALTLVEAKGGPRLLRLEVSNPDSSGVVVTPGARGYATSRVAAQLSLRIIVRRGRMDGDSFYSSAVAAGITDTLIAPFAKALAFDFDFQREVRIGDAFEAAFAQQTNAAGEPVGAPELLYASLTTSDKSVAVYRFTPPGGKPAWFDASGRSVVRALMRTPVDGARVSSGFGFRKHPILGFMKLHKGTDFAAPTGTPIFAAGDAQVDWAAFKGPNGNLVILRHDNGWQTFYLHLDHFAPGLAAGQRVLQGQVIGVVGTTGRSTGPHLHYELHIDSEPVDPLSIETEQGQTLSGAALMAFARARDRIDVSRAAQAG